MKHTCDCGRLAIKRSGGRDEWICERCHKLESDRELRKLPTQKTCGIKEPVEFYDWPSAGGFAYRK